MSKLDALRIIEHAVNYLAIRYKAEDRYQDERDVAAAVAILADIAEMVFAETREATG